MRSGRYVQVNQKQHRSPAVRGFWDFLAIDFDCFLDMCEGLFHVLQSH